MTNAWNLSATHTLGVVALSLSTLAAACDASGGSDENARFAPLVQALEAERLELGAPGVAVAVVERGEIVFATGLGSKRPDTDEPMAETTLFRVGSVGKMLTAAALLQLVDEGQVDLDQPLSAYMPDFEFGRDGTWADQITVEHLLTHQSGMVSSLTLDGPRADSELERQMKEYTQDSWLLFPPGAMWSYSNPGYAIAGLLVEKLHGQWYREIMHEHVLTPLGMDRTYFLPEEVLADGDHATGVLRLPDGSEMLYEPDAYDNPGYRPAGFVWSNALDLAQLATFLMEGNTEVLSDEQRLAMQAPQVNMNVFLDTQHYGYGLMIFQGYEVDDQRWYDGTIVSHGGGIPGYSSMLMTFPDKDLAIVLLANATYAYFPKSLAVFMETVVGAQLGAPPDPQIVADASVYAGTYSDPNNLGEVIVQAEGNKVYVELPALDAAGIAYEPELQPVSRDTFRWVLQGSGTLVMFIRDAQGTPRYMRTVNAVAIRTEAAAQGTTPWDLTSSEPWDSNPWDSAPWDLQSPWDIQSSEPWDSNPWDSAPWDLQPSDPWDLTSLL